MFRPYMYYVHTWNVQYHIAMNKNYKKQNFAYVRTWTHDLVHISEVLNHYASIVIA
jgi:hypothetical protein